LFGEKILAKVEFIAENPMLGSIVAEYGMPNLRERILQNYRIVYRISDERIEIVTLCHAAKLLQFDGAG
jgi:plasmid stabilization system protein ParE